MVLPAVRLADTVYMYNMMSPVGVWRPHIRIFQVTGYNMSCEATSKHVQFEPPSSTPLHSTRPMLASAAILPLHHYPYTGPHILNRLLTMHVSPARPHQDTSGLPSTLFPMIATPKAPHSCQKLQPSTSQTLTAPYTGTRVFCTPLPRHQRPVPPAAPDGRRRPP